MKILVIAATEAEIALSIKHITSSATEVKPLVFELNGHQIAFAATGVGLVATAYHLTRQLVAQQYDLVIQAGIAGCFDRNIPLGELLFVYSDRLADIGAEDGEDFIDAFDLGLVPANEQPFTNKLLVNPYGASQLGIQLREADAITISTVTGSDNTAERLQKMYNAKLESMEGAAFHYVCLAQNVAFAQVRAVSNYIERRNRGAWQIEQALVNLNDFVVRYVTEKTTL